jgi:CRISPR-associated exonuclease Cas4
MFVEGIWADNEHTAVGTLLHDHADAPGYETDAGVTILRAVPLFSERYGLSGKADIVEVRDIWSAVTRYRFESADKSAHSKQYAPVEYKKGKRRKWDNDDVQLCAQAFCLEEMFSVTVSEGFIYHAGSKRRRKVSFDESLRSETKRTIEAVRALIANREVPPAVLKPRCDGCSLRSICLPELTQIATRAKVNDYGKNLWT